MSYGKDIGFLRSIWYRSKSSRSIPLGPISLFFRFGRTVHVSSNTRRRLARSVSGLFRQARTAASPPPSGAVDAPPAVAETAVVVGVGPGLGFALARTLCAAGMNLALASRNAERLDALIGALPSGPEQLVRAYGCDATSERDVHRLFSLVTAEMAPPHLVVYFVQSFSPGRTIDIEVPAFEHDWRVNCLGAFVVAREAARSMAPLKRGTIVFGGSTSATIGRADHLNLAVGKFGVRALAQVMSRELWLEGIHVVHVVIDADISETDALDTERPQSDPRHIADQILCLHRQPRSCWSSEIDFRPFNERFWEHC